ncbi:MAG: hypothetical protein P8Y23_10640, partial [Candidatus Lokiarchaeota archaeon]
MSLDNNIEQYFYEELARYLSEKNFIKFTELLQTQEEKDFYYNPSKIKNRFEILSNLLKKTIRKVSVGYNTSALGEFIEILRFFNDQNLLERTLNIEDQKLLRKWKNDDIFLANLLDIFGKLNNSFILYIIKNIPQELYDFFISNPTPGFTDSDILIYYIKNVFFNQYTIYGLSIRYLGELNEFFKQVQHELEKVNFHEKTINLEFIEINIKYKFFDYYMSNIDLEPKIVTKKHLIYPKNILKYIRENLERINEYEYKFHSLSMVLLGGIGPQGHGFTYSTPRGEVVEICSDIKENQAIIVKYKLFLKEQFLNRLKKQLNKIDLKMKNQTISFLNHLITPNEIIGYKKMDHILSQVKTFLYNFEEQNAIDIKKLYNEISNSIAIILRPIRMVDQFKARMDLVSREKLKSEDIAK